MKQLLIELRTRNKLLYYAGWANLFAAIICVIIMLFDNTQVLGINAWIKPTKFFISILIFTWTMGWILHYLQRPRAVAAYSIMVVAVLTFEMVVIVWQAANGRLSHFNIQTPFYLMLFNLMGLAITILGVWTIVILVYFFTKKDFTISNAYLWGIRFGLLLFVIFSFEGGMMAVRLSHTVGAPDGGAGLPLVNWSKSYGDLRIAHFAGMHALQLLPLAGYFVFRKTAAIIIFSLVYLAVCVALTAMALKGISLINY